MNTCASLSLGDRLSGLLVGGAVGDALGLPGEGLSSTRQRRRYPGELQHRFLFGRGMISDDTEHAFMTTQALLRARGDVERFRQALAWQLRWWLAALPAGVGWATARAGVRLWCGVSARNSGVPSAGNGPAMRSPIIGAVEAHDAGRRRQWVEASTRLTHRDPRALTAALAAAEAAAWGIRGEPAFGAGPDPDWWQILAGTGHDDEWRTIGVRMRECWGREAGVGEFAGALGLERGVSGYAYHSVPVALYAWLRHRGDYRATVTAAIRCGGDTDTVGALAGSLAGLDVGVAGIPAEWRSRVWDWPRSTVVLVRAANHLAAGQAEPVRWFWPALIPRNLFFLAVVLAHGGRRLFPPY